MIEPGDVGAGSCLLAITRLDAVDDAQLAGYAALLSDGERERLARFRVERRRREFLTARALVRTTLARLAGVDAATISFRVGPWGKPGISAPPSATPFAFNVSHTDGMVVGLFARDREVGVDVERVDRRVVTSRLARRFFAASEADDVAARSGDDQRERFFAYWTLKEAYIKARGMGLALPLAAFAFSLAPVTTIAFDARIEDAPDTWQFGRADASARHRVAWAVRRRPRESAMTIVTRDVVPDVR